MAGCNIDESGKFTFSSVMAEVVKSGLSCSGSNPNKLSAETTSKPKAAKIKIFVLNI